MRDDPYRWVRGLVVQRTVDQERMWSMRGNLEWQVTIAVNITDLDRLFEMRNIQNVSPFVETVIAQRITDQERLISLLDIPDEPGHFPDDKECFYSVIEHLTSVDVLTKMRSRCRFQHSCRWIEARIEELQSPEDAV